MSRSILSSVLTGCLVLVCVACTSSRSRLGMVQSEDGMMYGSTMSNQFIVDSSLFENNRIKLRIRNTSGDMSFDMNAIRNRLETAYRDLGYIPTQGNDFGLLLDINVRYSGQIQDNMSDELRLVGGLGGGAAAYDPVVEGEGRKALATGAAGVVVGATLGHVLGSYITDDTYLVISDITLATLAPREDNDGTTLVFGKDKKISRKKNNFRGYRQRVTSSLAVYAGGRNVDQADIVNGVRERMLNVFKDII